MDEPLNETAMHDSLPRHWRSLEERNELVHAHDEFQPGAMDGGNPTTTGISRRNFLGLVGATAAVAATVACDKSGKSVVVPYTKRPREIVPGVANFYASTFPEGTRAYAVLVKTREGRPIHITGNDEHPGLRGKTSPRALADILRLYDPDRLRAPKLDRRPVSWENAGKMVAGLLAGQKPVLLLSGASLSPTRGALLAELQKAVPTLEHLTWEAGGALQGGRAAFGAPVILRPRLEKAQVILSLGADFLNGEDPEAIAAYTAPRRPLESAKEMNRLWVLEGPLTLTGSKADQRFPVRPSQLAALAFALAQDLKLPLPAGASLPGAPASVREAVPAAAWTKLLADLEAAGPDAVVLCGEAMPAEAHVAAALLNAMLGSKHVEARPAPPVATLQDLEAARRKLADGAYGGVILWDVNPVYAFPETWAQALRAVPTRIWIGLMEDESAAACQLLLPEHHWLEAWGDHEDGSLFTLQQPTIGALYDTRQGEDVLLAALRDLGHAKAEDYHTYLKSRWEMEVQPVAGLVPFERFWEAALHDGLLKTGKTPAAPVLQSAAVAEAAKQAFALTASPIELLLRPGTQVYDGRYANNGWLQELPDPVTKATWGNPLSLSVADARSLGVKDGDLVDLEAGGRKLTLPVLLQPGQAKGLVALSLGYGRTVGGVARGIGTNAFPLLDIASMSPNLRGDVKLTRTSGHREIPFTQNHHRLDGRDLVHSFSLVEFAKVKKRPEPDLATLYPDQQFPEHKWGMAIDLSACIGCSACVLACQSENNVPTVGPEQVLKGREMHWIRLDRYYAGSEDNPSVVHQPMLCQHCDSAPCENVCPVNATNHSPDGLNQMAYNRCVGTRYCANNCPYKVRRFNFLEFTAQKAEPESLVYNPEVTVRPRGVMEKCTFCVQRIQDVRMRAKAESRGVHDGEIVPACAAACPSQAITFGDLKDPKSLVAQLSATKRGFKVLEEVGARPAITYLADLRNPAIEGDSHEG